MKFIKKVCLVTVFLILFNIMSCMTFAESKERIFTENAVLDAFNEEMTLVDIDSALEMDDEEDIIEYEIDINENFTDEMVFVLVKREQSKIQQEYTVDDFKYLNLESIETVFEYRPEDNNQILLKLYLETPSKQNVIDAIIMLKSDSRVYHAFPNRIYTSEMEDLPTEITQSTLSITDTVSHSCIEEETANLMTAACCANKYAQSSDDNSNAYNDPVKIGIVDSGIYNGISKIHNKVEKYVDFTDDNSNVIEGYTAPVNIHGTSMASIIVKEYDEATEIHDCGNELYRGVCPNVELYSLKIEKMYTDDKTDISWLYTEAAYIIGAISYAINNNIKVLNMSISYKPPSEYSASNLADFNSVVNNYNGVIICSAGNHDYGAAAINNDTDSNIYLPRSSNSSNVIVVGGATHYAAGNRALIDSLSNYGQTTVDLFAYSRYYGYNCQYSNPSHTIIASSIVRETFEGSSSATARVSGAAAILLNICPTLTPSQIRHYLLGGVTVSSNSSSIPTNSNITDKCVTDGTLNIYKSVKMLISDLAYQGETVFAGHFTDSENMQVAAYCKTGTNQIKAYVWTYDTSTGKFSDPVHWFTQNNFNLDNNKQRSVSGDFDNNGYDEICTFKDNSAVFVCGNGYSKNTYTSSLSASGFTGRMVALDYDNDGKDEMAGIYDTGTWGHAKIYVWDFVSSGSGMSSNQICVYDSGAGNYEADYVTGRVVAGNFDDSDNNEEIAALYYFPTSGNYSLHRFDINGTTTTLKNLRYKQNDIDVSKVTGRVVACDYNAGTLDEVVCMYDNSANVSAGVINYGFYFTATTNSWTTRNLYTSSAGAHYASFSTNRMVAADFTGDALDDIVSLYKFDTANDYNDRGIICMSTAPELYGYFKKWDPKE